MVGNGCGERRNKEHAPVSGNNQARFALLGKLSFQSSGCTLLRDR